MMSSISGQDCSGSAQEKDPPPTCIYYPDLPGFDEDGVVKLFLLHNKWPASFVLPVLLFLHEPLLQDTLLFLQA